MGKQNTWILASICFSLEDTLPAWQLELDPESVPFEIYVPPEHELGRPPFTIDVNAVPETGPPSERGVL